jgi:hypothetical protein
MKTFYQTSNEQTLRGLWVLDVETGAWKKVSAVNNNSNTTVSLSEFMATINRIVILAWWSCSLQMKSFSTNWLWQAPQFSNNRLTPALC